MADAPEGDAVGVDGWREGTDVGDGIVGVFDLLPDVGLGSGLAPGLAVGAVVVDQRGDASFLEFAPPVVEMLFFEEGELTQGSVL